MKISFVLLTLIVSSQSLIACDWTDFAPAADSNVLHVASSGSDSADGSESAPLATIAKAFTKCRNGYPDQIRLHCGDLFDGRGDLEKGGRSRDEPLLVSSYGDGPRPIVSGSFARYWYANTPLGFSLNHVAIIGLDFRGTGSGNGILMRGRMDDILIENCSFTGYDIGAQIGVADGVDADGNPYPASNVTIRRSSFYENAAHGVLMQHLDNTLIEENIFDHNGYGEGIGNKPGESGPTIFKHNLYTGHMHGLIIRDNIFARGSNLGTKMKSIEVDGFTDFVVENNLYFNNCLGLDTGGNSVPSVDTYRHRNGVISDNVFTELGREFAGGGKQDLAVYALNAANVMFDGNHFVHKPDFATNPMFIWASNERSTDITIQNSVVYDWELGEGKPATRYFEQRTGNAAPEPGGITNFQLINNQVDLPAANYADPTRTVGSYYASIGGTGDAVAFLAAVRVMSKDNWDDRYTSAEVNDYIRAGFSAQADPVPVPVPKQATKAELLDALESLKTLLLTLPD